MSCSINATLFASAGQDYAVRTWDGTIKIMFIDTLDQQADIFTKALARDQFRCLRKFLIDW